MNRILKTNSFIECYLKSDSQTKEIQRDFITD